jgi:hypothetical protein
MVIDEDLLRRARESGARLADAAHQVEWAKADYHHAVRILHFAGASMREIAEALELSHQRVHPIIESTGGSGGWKSTKRSGLMTCTSCGRTEHEVTKLIAGPKIFICDGCVELAHRAATGSASTPLAGFARVDKLDSQCAFCAKAARDVNTLVAGRTISICDECLRLCDEVLAAAQST